ncbi:MAG: serine protease, partial [Chitinophagaceae bacterium]|nr:serine protease [Chitinophagaceae bacterium]
MLKKNLILFVIICVQFYTANAQSNKYWVFFKDKDTSNYNCSMVLTPHAIENRNTHGIPSYQYTDIPVNKSYVQSLEKMAQVETICQSRWLNGVSSFLTAEQKSMVEKLPFVKEVRVIDRNIVVTSTNINTDPAYMHVAMLQMGLANFLKASLDGSGVNIGVIDAGFFLAQSDKYTSHLVAEGKIKAQRDFIDSSRHDLITVSVTGADEHGKNVLRMIGGYDDKQRVL